MTCRRILGSLAVGLALTLATVPARALINPTFTPVQLVGDSSLILSLEIGPVGARNELSVSLTKTIKGKLPGESVAIDLGKTGANRVEELKKAIGEKKCPAMLFSFKGEAGDKQGALHVGTTWFPLSDRGNGHWQLAEGETQLLAVWAGGTEMLERVTEYVLTTPNAALPVSAGINWGTQTKIATVPGKVSAATAVDLKGDGHLALFLASDAGDHVLTCAPGSEKFTDATATLKLTSRSLVTAWGRFADNPRLALVSWDGKALTLWAQKNDGTFGPRPMAVGLKSGCIGLTAVDVNAKDRAGLLVSTTGSPLVLTTATDGKWTTTELPAAPGQKDLGQANPCIVADLDGDGLADVLQPLSKAAVLRRGNRAGGFEAPVVVPEIVAGEGRSAALLGDFSGEGRLDVVTLGEAGYGYFANRGNGKFADVSGETGEIYPKAQRNAIGGAVCDLNTDGRPDLLALYSDTFPQLYFNRGFRCFGYANNLGFENNATVTDTDKGQQSGVMANFAGSGAQALVLVLANGDVWALARAATPSEGSASHLGLVVTDAGAVGPTTVVAYDGKRCLGAQLVAPGAPAFFGKTSKGMLKLEWTTRDGAKQSQTVMVLKPTVISLRAAK